MGQGPEAHHVANVLFVHHCLSRKSRRIVFALLKCTNCCAVGAIIGIAAGGAVLAAAAALAAYFIVRKRRRAARAPSVPAAHHRNTETASAAQALASNAPPAAVELTEKAPQSLSQP